MNGWKTYKSSNALICWSECLSWHKSFSWQRKRYYCCTCSSSSNCLSTWWRYVLWFAQMECYDMSLDSTLKAPLLPCPFLFFSSFRWNPCTCTVHAHVADDDWVFMLGGPHFWIQCLIVLIQSEHHNHWLYPPVHDLLVAGGYRVLVYNIWLFSCNQSIITIGCILSMMANQGRPTLKIKKLKKKAYSSPDWTGWIHRGWRSKALRIQSKGWTLSYRTPELDTQCFGWIKMQQYKMWFVVVENLLLDAVFSTKEKLPVKANLSTTKVTSFSSALR